MLRSCGGQLYHHTTPSLEICNNKTETRFLVQIKPLGETEFDSHGRLSRRMRGSSEPLGHMTSLELIFCEKRKVLLLRNCQEYCIIFCVEMRCQEFLKLLKCLFNLHFKLNQQKIRLLNSPETDARLALTCQLSQY